VLKFGYKASAEQFSPRDLIDFSKCAEECGFDSVFISDHFQPWRHTGGHASFSLAWLGALDAPLVVVDDGDRLHPLLGRYDPTLLETLSKQLERQAPLKEVVAALGPRVVSARELERFGNPHRICLNVNTPADLEHAERLLSDSDRAMHLPPHSADLAR